MLRVEIKVLNLFGPKTWCKKNLLVMDSHTMDTFKVLSRSLFISDKNLKLVL